MKVKTRKTKSFPGDTWIGIDVYLDNGYRITPFGVWPRNDRNGRYYEGDGGGYFDNLKEAKAKALEIVKEEYKNENL